MSARNVHGLIQAQGGRREEEGDSRAGRGVQAAKKVSLLLSREERSTYPGQRREIRRLKTVTTASLPWDLRMLGKSAPSVVSAPGAAAVML